MKTLIQKMLEAADINRCADVLVVYNKQILLIKRPHDDDLFHNMWALPGGHVQEGETLEQGAQRECREESGIDEKPTFYRHHTYSDGFKTTLFYTLLDEKPVVKLSDEHVDYRWVAPEKALIMNTQGELQSILIDMFNHLNLL